jgi:hypothetical protein
LENTSDPAESQEIVRLISSSGHALERVTNVLDLSKVEAGKRVGHERLPDQAARFFDKLRGLLVDLPAGVPHEV